MGAAEPGSASEPTIESKTIYEGRILNLRVDTVRLPNGRTTTREIAEHSSTICVVPIDDQNNVLLVRQYRKPAEAHLLEVPAGGIEPGENVEEAVLRELQEEVSFTAGTLRRLAGFWISPGWCTEYMYSYLATDLRPADLSADDDENIVVERVPLEDTPGLIDRGAIQDSKSIASLLLALRMTGKE